MRSIKAGQAITTSALFLAALAGGFAAVHFSLPAQPTVAGVAQTVRAPSTQAEAPAQKPAATRAALASAARTGSATTADKRALLVDDMAAFVFAKGTPADHSAAAFLDRDGNPLTLGAWQGKVVLINLWATWCAPCLTEMPGLAALQADLGARDDFEVVAVSIDRRASSGKLDAFLKRAQAETLALYKNPDGKLRLALGAQGLPTTVLIGRDGHEIGRLVGPAEWDHAPARAIIQAALDGQLPR